MSMNKYCMNVHRQVIQEAINWWPETVSETNARFRGKGRAVYVVGWNYMGMIIDEYYDW